MQHQGSQAFNTPVACLRCPEEKLISGHEPEFFHRPKSFKQSIMFFCIVFLFLISRQMFNICIKSYVLLFRLCGLRVSVYLVVTPAKHRDP